MEPSQPNTRIAYSWAPGAAPGPTLNEAGSSPGPYGPVYGRPSAVTPYPAAVPATWVPWPLRAQSIGLSLGCGTGWWFGELGSGS